MLSPLPILFLFICKEAYGNIRGREAILRGQPHLLMVWSAGSFAPRKNKYLQENYRKSKIRPEREVRSRYVLSLP